MYVVNPYVWLIILEEWVGSYAKDTTSNLSSLLIYLLFIHLFITYYCFTLLNLYSVLFVYYLYEAIYMSYLYLYAIK